MEKPLKTPPPYAIGSVDHALRAAAMLQMEDGLSVSEIADRLGVARSTAHRVLAMLVYRDFAVRDEDHLYRAGPVLELATHSRSRFADLRVAALPHMYRLADSLAESVNLLVRTGSTVRFIASVEGAQTLRVSSREGMAFPAHRTSGGLLLLAALSPAELEAVYAPRRFAGTAEDLPDLSVLRPELETIRRTGFAVNNERSERGVVAVGVPVRAEDGKPVAGLAVAMPTVRYEPRELPAIVGALGEARDAIEADLAKQSNT